MASLPGMLMLRLLWGLSANKGSAVIMVTRRVNKCFILKFLLVYEFLCYSNRRHLIYKVYSPAAAVLPNKS
jgi:hypothetical protein